MPRPNLLRLNSDQILKLHDAAVRARLFDARDTLLAGIDPAFVAVLPVKPSPIQQILSDLHVLNDAEVLADGTVPLQLWLKNAIAITEALKEATVFEEFLLNASQTLADTKTSNKEKAAPRSASTIPITEHERDLEIAKSRHHMMIGVAAIAGLTVVTCVHSETPRAYIVTLATIVAFIMVSRHVRRVKRVVAAAAAGVTVGAATRALGQVAPSTAGTSVGTISGAIKFAAVAATAGGALATGSVMATDAVFNPTTPHSGDTSGLPTPAGFTGPTATAQLARTASVETVPSAESSATASGSVIVAAKPVPTAVKNHPINVAKKRGAPWMLPPPKVKMGATQVSGRLPQEVIERIVNQNMGGIRQCYENGLRKNPSLEGRILINFIIGRDGNVSRVATDESTLSDNDVALCAVRVFRALSFPQPEGGILEVKYPIVFDQEMFGQKPNKTSQVPRIVFDRKGNVVEVHGLAELPDAGVPPVPKPVVPPNQAFSKDTPILPK